MSDSPTTVHCPKCDKALAELHSACPTCGLARDRFEAFEDSPGDHAPGHLADAWAVVEKDWDSDDSHDSFAKLVLTAEAFSFAGRCYRKAGRARGSEDPRVVEGLRRVRSMAEAAWLVEKSSAKAAVPQGPSTRKVVSFVVVVALVAAVAGLSMILIKQLRPKPEVLQRSPPAKRIRGKVRATPPASGSDVGQANPSGSAEPAGPAQVSGTPDDPGKNPPAKAPLPAKDVAPGSATP